MISYQNTTVRSRAGKTTAAPVIGTVTLYCPSLYYTQNLNVSGSLFFQLFSIVGKKIFFIKELLCNFSMRLLKYFWKKFQHFFCHQKVEKTTPKSSILKQKFRRFRNFLLLPNQPRWQISCSKIWPIEQLYIELGVEIGEFLLKLGSLCKLFSIFFSKLWLRKHSSLKNKAWVW